MLYSLCLLPVVSRCVYDSLSIGDLTSCCTLCRGKVRTNVHTRNPRMISMDGLNKQRNGAIATQPSQTSAAVRANSGDDIDIQILQQKKQQAEIKRLDTRVYGVIQCRTDVVTFQWCCLGRSRSES